MKNNEALAWLAAMSNRPIGMPSAQMLEFAKAAGIPTAQQFIARADAMLARHARNAGKILGFACTYNDINSQGASPEPHRLLPGCFRASLYKVPLVVGDHTNFRTLVPALAFIETPTGLAFSAEIPATQEGRELSTILRSHECRTSIKARPTKTVSQRDESGFEWNDIVHADLDHVLLCFGDVHAADPNTFCLLTNSNN